MIELTGKYNRCKIFSDSYNNETVSQLITLLNQPCTEKSQIRIMPDYHAGKGAVIGTTMTLTDKVIPNLVGVDIGCGMLAVKLKERKIDLPALDSIIRKEVPSGIEIHNEGPSSDPIEGLLCDFNLARALLSIGTLGGGNHFIEIEKDSMGSLWLIIHTGSRHLGLEVCDYYQNLGFQKLKEKSAGGSYKELSEQLLERLKSQGKEKEINKELTILRKQIASTGVSVPQILAWVEGQDFKNYLHDMELTQQFAARNRAAIAKKILKKAKLHEVDRFETVHNYIDVKYQILRKGSVSAQAGERLLIPMNMRDGSLLCVGKGNEDWNYSAPHGAGRLMSRREAKETISMGEYHESMKGIYSTSVGKGTIDESPMAYKPMEEIIACIKDTVTIIERMKPIYNFKAGEDNISTKQNWKMIKDR